MNSVNYERIKLFFAAATLCAATFVGYNAYTNATMTEEERLIQANLEVLTSDGEEGDTARYDKLKSNCSKTFTIDAEGYVTIRGKRIPVGGGIAGSYTVTHSDAQIDCPAGNTYYTCSERTCEQYWNAVD